MANDKKKFWTLNDIFFEYELNNIYQTYYLHIITSVLNKYSPESLLHYFFSDSSDIENHRKLIDLLINHLINNNKFEFTLSRKVNNCYFPIEIKILNVILNSENDYIKNIIEADSDFKVINEVLVNKINDVFNFNQTIDVFEFNSSLKEMINESIKIFKVYRNGDDYYKGFSSAKYVKNINKPFLVISSKDDPISTYKGIPIDDICENEKNYLHADFYE